MRALLYALIALVLFVWIFPIYWTVATSLKVGGEIQSATPTLFPHQFSIEHYRNVLVGSEFSTFVQNSLVVGIGVVLVTLLLSCCSAFALSRLRFPHKNWVGSLILLVYLFPGILLVIPLFKMMAAAGLYNNLLSLIIIHVVLTLPFATWTLRDFFNAIPGELADAALVDGARYTQILRHIYLPLAAPGMAVAAIFAFVVSWNDYIFAVIMISDNELNTVPLGIAAWTSSYSIDWGSLTAASVLTIVPAFVFFAFLGRLFVRGLTAGATKG
jgi:ABC-type glycerol-3-phosphate transport system permease component